VNRYSILYSDAETAIFAIEDSAGKCHLGRALTAPLAPGATLQGGSVVLGLTQLHAPDQVVPVVLVLLDCDKAVAVLVAGGHAGHAAIR
jgi:hypothetical protein